MGQKFKMEQKKEIKKCHFCVIGRGEKEEEILYETDNLVAFPDNKPVTSTHILIMPREHFNGYADVMTRKPELLLEIGEAVEVLIDKLGLRGKGKGYTWGFHCGGKESVAHVHAQLLAGMKKDELVL